MRLMKYLKLTLGILFLVPLALVFAIPLINKIGAEWKGVLDVVSIWIYLPLMNQSNVLAVTM